MNHEAINSGWNISTISRDFCATHRVKYDRQRNLFEFFGENIFCHAWHASYQRQFVDLKSFKNTFLLTSAPETVNLRNTLVPFYIFSLPPPHVQKMSDCQSAILVKKEKKISLGSRSDFHLDPPVTLWEVLVSFAWGIPGKAGERTLYVLKCRGVSQNIPAGPFSVFLSIPPLKWLTSF